MQLLPPGPDVCPICAIDHKPDEPHNQRSIYYQYRFYGIRGRWPTWADAVAHCSPEVQAAWKEELGQRGVWSEPKDGEPIADPLAESVRQCVGGIESFGFGPSLEGEV